MLQGECAEESMPVIPAQAGIQRLLLRGNLSRWVPACAGTTPVERAYGCFCGSAGASAVAGFAASALASSASTEAVVIGW